MDPHSQNESLTNGMNSQVYERLTARDRQRSTSCRLLPPSGRQVGPLVWRFKLRPNVRFHDGSAFTADDVVFSLQRAKAPTSQVAVYANAVGTARKIDEPHRRDHPAALQPDLPAAPGPALHHEQVLERSSTR